MSTVKIYGLPHCDSTAAAIKWFEKKGIKTSLHNYKNNGITHEKISAWAKELGWQKVLNKRSTTWRGLKKEEQDAVGNEQAAVAIMLKNTSLIKRPVIESGKKLLIGYDEKILAETFG